MKAATYPKKKKNLWKLALLSILVIELATVVVVFAMLTNGFSAADHPIPRTDRTKGKAIFSVQANKQQLENMINDQIDSNGNNRLTYHIDIDDHLVLNGKYKLLFTAIPFSLTFTPSVSNGDIVLKETDVKLGSIPLPDKQVLSFLKSGSKFPKWVAIQPNKRQIYINLTDVQVQKGLYLRAQTINLAKNDVTFSVHQMK
ncbi:YpmS family protein [Sporolactobacillus shoreicorticis]|uniref:YpmS family protein n=1 Tax=Sporolactobacillus shoreicorticis TaxID=1923877 RepID=A0ABW5RX72_9BACL|nr:YpmS family protein [Sporolactobacillus shoreicorticis]MCO7124937.1 YpmS family protein [Sporolactobacillus shoreicorticis]